MAKTSRFQVLIKIEMKIVLIQAYNKVSGKRQVDVGDDQAGSFRSKADSAEGRDSAAKCGTFSDEQHGMFHLRISKARHALHLLSCWSFKSRADLPLLTHCSTRAKRKG